VAVFGWDIETNQLNPFVGEPLVLTVACHGKAGPVGCIVDHPLSPPWDCRPAGSMDHVARVLADPENVVVGHNLVAFDVPFWEAVIGQRIQAQLFDTRVAYSLLNENSELTNSNTLEILAEKYTKLKKNEGGLDRRRLAEAPPGEVLVYNMQDARISYELYAPLLAELKENGLEELMRFRMDVGRVLVDMTLTGTHLDVDWAAHQGDDIAGELAVLEATLHGQIGEREILKRKYNRKTKLYETHTEFLPYNLASSTQLSELLFGVLKLPVVAKTDKGQPSTKEEDLKELRRKISEPVMRQLLDGILKYRELSKLQGTYLQPLTTKHRGNDGRVHTTFNLAGTVTGRLSSSEPNLQNIPRDKRVKGVLAATPGLRLFNADYSQLELRVAAWYAQEPSMLKAFAEGLDVHTMVLSEMEGKEYSWVRAQLKAEGDIGGPWTEKRALIKPVNFLVLYGGGPYRLVKSLADLGIYISQKRAEGILQQWFARYSRIAEWIEEAKQRIVRDGRVVTPTGRVRRLPGVDPTTPSGQRALRQGVNFLIQSLAGEAALMSLIEVQKFFEREGGGRLLLTVHDSVVGEYHPDDWAEADLSAALSRLMVEDTLAAMERRFNMPPTIPLAVDVKLGQERWA
jgi:DNA polymerase I-like protein with 3'-5' exonuclease and polymerase domains